MQREEISSLLNKAIEARNSQIEDYREEGLFEVELLLKPGNDILIYIDSVKGVSIEDCISISRFIEGSLDREEEDFSLQVSSAGLDQPFKIWKQYKKNEGKRVKVLCADGTKYKGVLVSANEQGIVFEKDKQKQKGKKAKTEEQEEENTITLDYSQIKETKIEIVF